MLIEIKYYDSETSTLEDVMLDPNSFDKCFLNKSTGCSYTLILKNGDKYILLRNEVDYLEKLGYIKRRK